jgi:hypothetical protein
MYESAEYGRMTMQATAAQVGIINLLLERDASFLAGPQPASRDP